MCQATFCGLRNLEKFQAKVRAVLAKLSTDVNSNYEGMKMAILRELQLSSNVYLERFNTAADEMYVVFASKLRTLLENYLTSRDVTQFDRIKSSLTEGR